MMAKTRDIGLNYVTLEQYRDALALFNAGRSPKEIRHAVKLSGPQFHALYYQGLPVFGHRPAQPPFVQVLNDELAAFTKQRNRAAKAVSSKAVGVLRKSAENGDTAATIIRMILRLQAEKLKDELDKPPVERKNIEKVMLGDNVYKALGVLHKVQDISNVTRAFAGIWGTAPSDNPAMQMPRMPKVASLPGAGKETLPAALAMLEEISGPGAKLAVYEEIIHEINHWTTDEKERFAQTGEEPDPPKVDEDEVDDDEDDDDLAMIDTVVVDHARTRS